MANLAPDPAAIRSLVQAGKKGFDSAARLLHTLLVNQESQIPNDENYATAIQAGLFEMCLTLAGESFVVEVMMGAGAVTMGRKCTKALSEMSSSLQ